MSSDNMLQFFHILRGGVAALLLVTLASPAVAIGTDITSLNTTITTGTAVVVNGITYRNHIQAIQSFQTGGSGSPLTWVLAETTVPQFTLRRVSAGNTDGYGPIDNRQLVWQQQANGGRDLLASPPTTTQNALAQNNIYQGTDNIFTNVNNSAGNQSNVERVDVFLGNAYFATDTAGFTVFERGVNTAHDAFGIAAITGFNAQGQPLYGSLYSFAAGSWGLVNLTNPNNDYSVLNTASSPQFTVSTSVSDQPIGGVLIRLTELATPGTLIYGYSLFGPDVTAAYDLTNFSLFPTSTPEVLTGLDLIAANIGLVKVQGVADPLVPEPSPEPGTLLLAAALYAGGRTVWQLGQKKAAPWGAASEVISAGKGQASK